MGRFQTPCNVLLKKWIYSELMCLTKYSFVCIKVREKLLTDQQINKLITYTCDTKKWNLFVKHTGLLCSLGVSLKFTVVILDMLRYLSLNLFWNFELVSFCILNYLKVLFMIKFNHSNWQNNLTRFIGYNILFYSGLWPSLRNY